MSDYTPCGIGPCSAPEGHEGTCAQASGWDKFTDDAKDAAYDAGFAAGLAAALAARGTEEPEWEYGIRDGYSGNVISVGAPWMDREFAEKVTANDSDSHGIRRRKAGPWLSTATRAPTTNKLENT